MSSKDLPIGIVIQELTEFRREFADYLTVLDISLPPSEESSSLTVQQERHSTAVTPGSVSFTTLEKKSFTATITTSGWFVHEVQEYFESSQEMLSALSSAFEQRWGDDLSAKLGQLKQEQQEEMV